MINLRYHIVSITAVFLALGIGLTLGSTFLDRVTVDNLKSQLDTVQSRVEESEAVNAELRHDLDELIERDADLAEAIPERLFGSHLSGVPVLVIATEGSSTDLVDSAVNTLVGADADVVGSWWLQDRWLLQGDDDVDQLRDALALNTSDADRLRRIAAIRLSNLLADAARPPALDPALAGESGATSDLDPEESGAVVPEGPVAPPEPVEPELLVALEASGFVEYRTHQGAASDRVRLPAAGLRYVVVSGAPASSGPGMLATALLNEMTGDGPAPVVAAQGAVDLRTDSGDLASDGERRTTFVGPLREGELTSDRLITIDSLDSAAGLAALVLAVEDLAEGRMGHYGTGPGAGRLLPGPLPVP